MDIVTKLLLSAFFGVSLVGIILWFGFSKINLAAQKQKERDQKEERKNIWIWEYAVIPAGTLIFAGKNSSGDSIGHSRQQGHLYPVSERINSNRPASVKYADTLTAELLVKNLKWDFTYHNICYSYILFPRKNTNGDYKQGVFDVESEEWCVPTEKLIFIEKGKNFTPGDKININEIMKETPTKTRKVTVCTQ